MTRHATITHTFLRSAFAGALTAALSFSLVGCSSQGMAYKENPICREAQQKCKVYYETMDRTKTDRGAGIDLLREDCEASQRACADGVSRSLETSHPGEPGKRSRWQDMFYR